MNRKPSRFVASRFLKAILTYLLVVYCCGVAILSPILNILLEPLEAMGERWVFSALYFTCYSALPFFFYVIIQEADERKLSLAVQHPKPPAVPILIREIASSRDFYYNALPLLFFLLALPPKGSLALLYGLLPSMPYLVQRLMASLLYGAFVFGLLFLAELLLRKDWYRQWRYQGFSLTPEGLAEIPVVSKKKLAFHIFLITVTVFLLPAFGIYFQMLRVFILLFWDSVSLRVILVAAFFYPSFREWRRKKRILRELKRECGHLRMPFQSRGALFRGILGLNPEADFTVETEKIRYVGRILPVRSKRSVLLFHREGYYRFEKRILAWYVPFFRHLRKPIKESDQGGKEVREVVILSQEPKKIFFGDEDRYREAWSRDSLGEYEIYHSSAFLSKLISHGR